MGRGIDLWFHLIEGHPPAPLGNLPCGFTSCQSGTDDNNRFHDFLFYVFYFKFAKPPYRSAERSTELTPTSHAEALSLKRKGGGWEVIHRREAKRSNPFIRKRGIHIPYWDIASRPPSFLVSVPRMGNRTEDTSLGWVCPIGQRCNGDSWCSCKRFFLYGSFVQRSSHRIPLEDTSHPYLKVE